MALRKYLKKIEPEDNRKSDKDSSSLSRKDVEMAGREVWRVLEELQLLHDRSVAHGSVLAISRLQLSCSPMVGFQIAPKA